MRDSLDNNKNANESLKSHLSIDVPATSSAREFGECPSNCIPLNGVQCAVCIVYMGYMLFVDLRFVEHRWRPKCSIPVVASLLLLYEATGSREGTCEF